MFSSSLASVPPLRPALAGSGRDVHFRVAPLEAHETGVAIELLARAFRDNPLNRAVIGPREGKRMRANRHGMRSTFGAVDGVAEKLAILPTQGGSKNNHPLGVLVGFGQGSFPAPLPSAGAQVRCLLGQGWRVMRRWGQVHHALSRRHILEPHCYLGLLGVRVDRQREGLGSELLRAWLEEVDAQGLPAYLETDLERNIAFYGREGFEVDARMRIFDTDVWCMRRPPSSDTGTAAGTATRGED